MTLSPSRELAATEALILSLDEYIRARYGLLAAQTFEEERFLRFMRGVADHERHRAKGLYTWSRTRGLRLIAGPGVGTEPRAILNREDVLSVIEYIEEAEQGLYVLSDFAPYLLEYGAPKPELVRRLRELAWAIRSRPVTVIFLGARFPEIPELEKEVKVLDLPLPEEAETAEILDRETERLRGNPNATVALDGDARANLIQALLGLTAINGERAGQGSGPPARPWLRGRPPGPGRETSAHPPLGRPELHARHPDRAHRRLPTHPAAAAAGGAHVQSRGTHLRRGGSQGVAVGRTARLRQGHIKKAASSVLGRRCWT
jgi:hypothetical protein